MVDAATDDRQQVCELADDVPDWLRETGKELCAPFAMFLSSASVDVDCASRRTFTSVLAESAIVGAPEPALRGGEISQEYSCG